MRFLTTKSTLALAFAFGTFALSFAADEKKPDTKPVEEKAPDWSGFVKGPILNGEVSKIETSDRLTVKIVKSVSRGKPRYEEMTFDFAEGGLIRWSKPPAKVDENGKKKILTFAERQALKTPKGVPGYRAERDELQVGHIVQIELVLPKDIPRMKATPQDFKVKYATIVGYNPGPGGN